MGTIPSWTAHKPEEVPQSIQGLIQVEKSWRSTPQLSDPREDFSLCSHWESRDQRHLCSTLSRSSMFSVQKSDGPLTLLKGKREKLFHQQGVWLETTGKHLGKFWPDSQSLTNYSRNSSCVLHRAAAWWWPFYLRRTQKAIPLSVGIWSLLETCNLLTHV